MAGARTPLILIGGFPGSGKTTLLSHLLRTSLARQRVAVMLNDFGAAALDAAALRNPAEDVIKLEGGCACCTLSTDFASGLARLLAAGRYDRILMETSGISSIQNLRRLLEWPTLVSKVEVERVITVADASRLPAWRRQIAIVGEQVRQSDLVLLNRCDLASADQIQATRETIEEINPAVPVLATIGGRIDFDSILDPLQAVGSTAARLAEASAGLPDDALACRIVLFANQSRDELQAMLQRLPSSLLRLEGFVKIVGDGLARVELKAGRASIEICSSAVPARALGTLSGIATPDLADALEMGLEGRLGIRVIIDHAPRDRVPHKA